MVEVIFEGRGGECRKVRAEHGSNLMQAALDNGVKGIVADCGGALACATCHVYVAAEWVGKVGRAVGAEAEMLEMAIDPGENSRLSCQIVLTDELDGLHIMVPDTQF